MRLLGCVLWLALAVPAGSCQAPAAPPAANPVAAQEPSLRERAFGAENQGRFADAAEAFLQLAKAEPTRAEWVVAAGRCLGRSGRFKEAIDLLDGARKTFPGVIDVPAMLARTLLLRAETDRGALHPEILWADAAELAEGVLRLDPDHEDSRLLLAQARYLQGDFEQAKAQAEQAVQRHPQRPGAHVLLGRIAGDRFRALLRQYEAEQPTGQAAADLVAAIAAQRSLAAKEFARAAELDPTRAHPHVALGQIALLDKRDEAARGHFVDALVADPDAAFDHAVLERGLDWKGRAALYVDAHRRYLAVPDGKPAKAATLRWYEGRARFDGQQWQEAAACFQAALAGNPTATNCHYYLALCAYQAGDHDAAERHAATYAALGAAAFADVIRALSGEQRGQTGAIVQFLADRAYQQGRRDHSRDLNHVIACLKDSADAWNNHAFLCRETGRFADALSSYQHALEKEPDSPQLLNDAAVVLHYHLPSPANLQQARGMYERALQLADKVLADAGASPTARERAGKAKQDAQLNLAELPK